MVCVSTIAWNSVLAGSGASLAMILIESSNGNPALMPRTMTSTESGNELRNLFSRRFLRNDSAQNGRPNALAKPSARASSNPPPITKIMRNMNSPKPPASHHELLLGQAETRLMNAGLQRRLLRLVVFDLEVFEAFLDLLAPGFLRAAAHSRVVGSDSRDALPAPLGRALAGQQRIKEHPGDAADRDRHQKNSARLLHLHGGYALPIGWVSAILAASSAAARRFSSP